MRNRLLITLASIGLLSPAAVSGAFAAEAAPAKAAATAASVFRMPLGDFEIIALSDGSIALPMDNLMSNPARVREMLTKAGQTLPVPLSVNAYVIKAGGKHILVDTGAGALFGAGGPVGHLQHSLSAAGLSPAQIDAVLVTHLHGDHAGGLVADGKPVFSNATVYADKKDTDFWLSLEAEKAAPEDKREFFRIARQVVGPYQAAGKLKTFNAPAELFPGIRALPTYGHTPGHTAYMVESKGQRLLLWGDVLHVEQVQFAEPDITVDFDINQPAALATRKRQLEEAAAGGYLVGSAHIAFPGIGHVRKAGQAYAWEPVKAKKGAGNAAK